MLPALPEDPSLVPSTLISSSAKFQGTQCCLLVSAGTSTSLAYTGTFFYFLKLSGMSIHTFDSSAWDGLSYMESSRLIGATQRKPYPENPKKRVYVCASVSMLSVLFVVCETGIELSNFSSLPLKCWVHSLPPCPALYYFLWLNITSCRQSIFCFIHSSGYDKHKGGHTCGNVL